MRVVHSSGARSQLDLHATRDRPSQHRPELADDGVELKVLRIHRATVRERQELPRERRAALGCQPDLNDIVTHLAAVGQRVLHELRIVHDHREDVVEVMRDPASEPTDALEPLGLTQPLLETELLLLRRASGAQITDEGRENVTC